VAWTQCLLLSDSQEAKLSYYQVVEAKLKNEKVHNSWAEGSWLHFSNWEVPVWRKLLSFSFFLFFFFGYILPLFCMQENIK
jgi:hypothetical protein